jgi:hypothetical protein
MKTYIALCTALALTGSVAVNGIIAYKQDETRQAMLRNATPCHLDRETVVCTPKLSTSAG